MAIQKVSVRSLLRAPIVGGISIALLLNLFFWWYMVPEYHAITLAHGNVAYNLYQSNRIGINRQLKRELNQRQGDRRILVDLQDVKDAACGVPDEPFPVNDTVGYGILIGCLWKITHSLSFADVIILQILLYLIMVFLIGKIGTALFGSTAIACYGVGGFLLYVPLIALNVHAVRDVWAAYGLIVLMYAIIQYFFTSLHDKRSGMATLIVGSLFFSLCQWIRPSIFLAVITFSVGLIAYAALNRQRRARSAIGVSVMLIINILCFWVPFIYHNKYTYDRYFVSPAGQDLLEGLGEFNNPWGYQLSDEYVAQLIEGTYGSRYGTPQFDDDAKTEFLKAYAQQPGIFWKNIIKRVPMVVLPALPWLFYSQSPYPDGLSALNKLRYVIMHPQAWIDFIVRHCYIRAYIILGYIGILLLCWHRRWGIVMCMGAVLIASLAKLPSHIEYRYLTPYYWVLCFGIGYLINVLMHKRRSL